MNKITVPCGGPYIQTYTGKHFHFLDAQHNEIDIVDIAHALSNQCRFAGHIDRFYSVAEHSYWVAQMMPEGKPDRLCALLHDATEAYLCDIPTPLKELLPDYQELEKRLHLDIMFAFNLPESKTIWDKVKARDLWQLTSEAKHLFLNKPIWIDEFMDLGVKPECWSPEKSKQMFLKLFRELIQ